MITTAIMNWWWCFFFCLVGHFPEVVSNSTSQDLTIGSQTNLVHNKKYIARNWHSICVRSFLMTLHATLLRWLRRDILWRLRKSPEVVAHIVAFATDATILYYIFIRSKRILNSANLFLKRGSVLCEQLIHPIVSFLAFVLANFDMRKFRSSYGEL